MWSSYLVVVVAHKAVFIRLIVDVILKSIVQSKVYSTKYIHTHALALYSVCL